MAARESQPTLSLESFLAIRSLVRSFAGMQLSDDGRSAVERRLADRLEVLELHNFEDYVRYLRQHMRGVSELELAVELLATNETYFFRELPQLRAFEHSVLPQLRELGEVRRSLSVWSAGCSTGEEVYTLAILIAASELFNGFTVRVLGSDISRRVLQVARKGVYRDSSFRAMPHSTRHSPQSPKHDRGSGDKAVCHFAHLNLLDDSRRADRPRRRIFSATCSST